MIYKKKFGTVEYAIVCEDNFMFYTVHIVYRRNIRDFFEKRELYSGCEVREPQFYSDKFRYTF